jgi:hypothetical protein
MKSHFNARWWILFFILNLVPSSRALAAGAMTPKEARVEFDRNFEANAKKRLQERAAAIRAAKEQHIAEMRAEAEAARAPIGQAASPGQAVSTGPIHLYAYDMAAARELISDFGISDELDSSKQIVLKGEVPKMCKQYLQIKSSVKYLNDQLAIQVLDRENLFEACVQECREASASASQCEKVSISDLVKITSAEKDLSVVLDSADKLEDFLNAEGEPVRLASQRNYKIALLTYQLENCRGGNSDEDASAKTRLENDMRELALAESAGKQLKAMIKDRDSKDFIDDTLKEIRDQRTQAQRDYVLTISDQLNGINGLPTEENKKLIADLRKEHQAFSKKYKVKEAAVSNELAAVSRKIALIDVGMHVGDNEGFSAAVTRAKADLKSAKGLRGLNAEGRETLDSFAVAVNLYQVDHHDQFGQGASLSAMAMADATGYQVGVMQQQYGCRSAGGRVRRTSINMPAQSSTICGLLDYADKRVKQTAKRQKQMVAYEQKLAQTEEHNDLMDELARQNEVTRQEISELNNNLGISAFERQRSLNRNPSFNNTNPNGVPSINGSGGMFNDLRRMPEPIAPRPLEKLQLPGSFPSQQMIGESRFPIA